MFKRLPSTCPAPDRASLRKLHNSGRNALSATFPLSRRSLLLPCALGLLMSAAMLACGSDDTQQQPGSDQPAAAVAQENTNATASTSGSNQPEQSSNDGRNTPAERNAPNANAKTTAHQATPPATTPATATTAPTPTPEPTATPAPRPLQTHGSRRWNCSQETWRRGSPAGVHRNPQLQPLAHHRSTRRASARRLHPKLWENKLVTKPARKTGYFSGTNSNKASWNSKGLNPDSPELHVKVTVPS